MSEIAHQIVRFVLMAVGLSSVFFFIMNVRIDVKIKKILSTMSNKKLIRVKDYFKSLKKTKSRNFLLMLIEKEEKKRILNPLKKTIEDFKEESDKT